MTIDNTDDLSARREAAFNSLIKSFTKENLSTMTAFAIVTSFMSIEDLERCVKWQEAQPND